MIHLLDAKFIVESDSLERLYGEWDSLALACELPLMAPAWLLAWWRHIAPPTALLRAIQVRDASGALVGFAPLYVPPRRAGRVEFRVLGAGMATPLGLLSQPGREREVATAISRALSEADPRPDVIMLPGTQLTSRWHAAIRDGWPGRVKPITSAYRTRPYPRVLLHGGSLDAWLAGRSSKFRYSMRRLGRLLAEQGGSWRMSTEATLPRDIKIFLRLHEARWRGRGESTLASAGQRGEAMLNDVGRALIADERFRLWLLEIEGEVIAADVYLCGGGVAVGINGGWDERFKPLSPPLLATMHTIEDAIARGERRVDLGPGDESHKTRFANDDSPVTWSVLMTPGGRLAQTLALTAPMLAGNAVGNLAKRLLKPEQVDALRELRRATSGSLASRRRRSGTAP